LLTVTCPLQTASGHLYFSRISSSPFYGDIQFSFLLSTGWLIW
jgi:hypothetical protein